MTAVLEDAQELKISKWGTLNTAASPNKLPEGHSPNNQNVWMDEKPGSVVTANGYIKLGTLPSNLPPTFGIDFFKTSDGSSRFVVSDGQNVYQTTDYVNYTTITTGLSEFFQLRGRVIRDKLWLTNGSDSVMTWDGSTLTTLDGTGGTPNVPKGKYIEYHDERVWMYGINGDLSALRFTALADSSGTEIAPTHASAWPADNEIQVSEGDADVGTGMWLFRGYLYCSKQFSIWRIVGSDEYDYTRVKTRASTGTRFQESVQIKDNLVHFIGVDGGYVFDGEDATRITDIIDPASSDEGVFAFRNLQQPLLNNQFWNVSETADFAAGTVPANLSTATDELALIPAEDSQADFAAGTLTDTTASDNPGFLQLALVTSGGTTENVALTGTPSLGSGPGARIGSASSINDDSLSAACGFQLYANGGTNFANTWQVIFPSTQVIGSATLKDFYAEGVSTFTIIAFKLQYTTDGVSWSDVPSGTLTAPSINRTSGTILYPTVSGGSTGHAFIDEVDVTKDFTVISALGLRAFIQTDSVNVTIRELQVFQAGYKSTGSFISKTLDYGAIPATFGELAASIEANGETYQFSTQSSTDGSTWDAAVNVANGAAIGSTPKRYLRWRVTLNSSTGLNTPVIDKVYVGGTYLSEIHDTGGNIFQWAAFQMTQDRAGQTINAYYRAASTSLLVASESWTAIVPGAAPGADLTDTFIQVKLELSTTDSTQIPTVQSFTVNWILANGTGINTLQNVASIIWLNRYWLTAATLGAEANDIVLVLGKSTFQSPWHQKDFSLLMFCRYQNILIAGSSVDGSLYRLEYGFSKDGEAMDSFYETADLSRENFQMKGRELVVTLDRSGPYSIYIGWSTDGGLTWTEKAIDLTRNSGQSLSFTYKINHNWMSDTVRYRVRINAADQPFSVDEMTQYYRLTPQRGTMNV